VHIRSGDREKARKVLQELEQERLTAYVPCMASAFVYEGLGEHNKAIEMLEKACENRETNLAFLKTWPYLDSLRDDHRFQKIERRVGLRT